MKLNLLVMRKKAGLTQRQISEKAKISERVYQAYEYNKCEPSVRTALRIAKALGIKTLEGFEALWE